jgi:hypothetical protein
MPEPSEWRQFDVSHRGPIIDVKHETFLPNGGRVTVFLSICKHGQTWTSGAPWGIQNGQSCESCCEESSALLKALHEGGA